MKKILLISVYCLTAVSALGFVVLGGWKPGELIVRSVRGGEDGKYLWRSFLQQGTVKDGFQTFNGFWITRESEQIWVWTASGIGSYRLASQTRYFYTEVCSEEATKQRILYGARGANGKYVSLIDFGKLLKPGEVVSLKIRQKDGIVESISYTDANYYSVTSGYPPDKVCK